MSVFRFRHFDIRQDHAALKVGTDAMVLGALCDFTGKRTVLDIGTGTGVLSLIVAQRFSPESITAAEIDTEAARDAAVNFESSPFAAEIRLLHSDILDCRFEKKFDGIVSNPPFFVNSTRNRDAAKTVARHTDELSYENLLAFAAANLSPDGIFWLILPSSMTENICAIARRSGLYPRNIVLIEGKPGNTVRTVISFTFSNEPPRHDKLVIRDGQGNYTESYIKLTRELHGTSL
jgi:tRNA1Val (adenine37-N6)-methyltransferase